MADVLSELEATRERNRDAWTALRMVREAVETHMPPGALPEPALVRQGYQHSLLG